MSRGLEAMRVGAGGVLMDRDVVRISGADASSYLQGQISQDVESVAVGESAWSLILQPQGRIDAWFRLTRLGSDEFLLDVDAGHGAGLVERLEQFRLRVDVEVEGLSDWRMLAIRGPQANSSAAGLTDVSAEGSVQVTTGALAAAGAAEAADQPDYEGRGGHGLASTGPEVRAAVDWPGYEGVDWLFSGSGPGPDAWPDGLAEADRAGLEVLRIRAGWPVMGAEIGHRTIPAELGPCLISKSVSFTKGCYTGQELVARIDSRGGNVPRPLRMIEIADAGDADAGDLAPGAAVTVDGETVGEVTSAAFDPASDLTVALGPVHRRVEPPAAVAVAGRDATVRALPTPD